MNTCRHSAQHLSGCPPAQPRPCLAAGDHAKPSQFCRAKADEADRKVNFRMDLWCNGTPMALTFVNGRRVYLRAQHFRR